MSKAQPKIVQKLVLRTALLLFGVAAVFLGIRYLLAFREDPDAGGRAETVGFLAAIEIHEDGEQVVVFDTAGDKKPSPGYAPGKMDQDPAWRPDGNQLFFSSNRESDAFNLYRWNFASNEITQRSTGSNSKFALNFHPGSSELGLITSGGRVLEFNAASANTTQLLPPQSRDLSGSDEEGVKSQFESIYSDLGQSFRNARMTPDREWVVAVMRRETGELLVIQRTAAEKVEDLLPITITSGAKVDFDIDPNTGVVYYSTLNFEFPNPEQVPPEFIKNGRVVPPFLHEFAAVDPKNARTAEGRKVFMRSSDNKTAFGPPVVSPSGEDIVLTTGTADTDGNYTPSSLVIVPLAGTQPSMITRGAIYDVSWSPDGRTLAYIMERAGKSAIFTINRDGSGEKQITTDGNFKQPKFSPQKASG